jgi:hypothetical protein
MCAKEVVDDTTTWVPICCQTVMRHNFFRGEDDALAATLVCPSCGKHVTLQPHTSGPIEQYGEGTRLLQVVSVSRPKRRGLENVIAPMDREGTL